MRRECWLCGSEVPTTQFDRVVGMHRDVETTNPWIVVIRTTWQTTSVRVPRCGRCRHGHRIEQSLMVLAIVGVIAYAAGGQLDEFLGIAPNSPGGKVSSVIWAAVAGLPVLAWIATRQAWLPWRVLAPRRLRHARRYPAVRRLRADGWHYRSAPLPDGLRDWDLLQPATSSSRPRRIAAALSAFLGFAGLVVAIILFIRGREVAAVFLVAAFALMFLATRLVPER